MRKPQERNNTQFYCIIKACLVLKKYAGYDENGAD